MKQADKNMDNSPTFLQIKSFLEAELARRRKNNLTGIHQLTAIIILLDELNSLDESPENLPVPPAQTTHASQRRSTGGNSQDPPPRKEIDES